MRGSLYVSETNFCFSNTLYLTRVVGLLICFIKKQGLTNLFKYSSVVNVTIISFSNTVYYIQVQTLIFVDIPSFTDVKMKSLNKAARSVHHGTKFVLSLSKLV